MKMKEFYSKSCLDGQNGSKSQVQCISWLTQAKGRSCLLGYFLIAFEHHSCTCKICVKMLLKPKKSFVHQSCTIRATHLAGWWPVVRLKTLRPVVWLGSIRAPFVHMKICVKMLLKPTKSFVHHSCTIRATILCHDKGRSVAHTGYAV